jgi:formylglycine-generating enzyme required for sulfatase activity
VAGIWLGEAAGGGRTECAHSPNCRRASSSISAFGWIGFICSLLIVTVQLGCDNRSSLENSKAGEASPGLSNPGLVPLTNMVLIKAGTFMRIKYPVTITRDFWIGKYEVTQGQFSAVLGRNPSHFPGDPNRPVEKVTFIDASAYCSAITQRERQAKHLPMDYEYRLPSEAEWEYACRAGTTNFFSFGDDPSTADQFAWTAENSEATTHPVGLKRPNPWGLYDMHGNVWEWCLDWFEPYPALALTNPVGPASSKFKVFRGGGWNQDIEYARSSNRFMMAPSNGIHFVGFRLALGPIHSQPK